MYGADNYPQSPYYLLSPLPPGPSLVVPASPGPSLVVPASPGLRTPHMPLLQNGLDPSDLDSLESGEQPHSSSSLSQFETRRLPSVNEKSTFKPQPRRRRRKLSPQPLENDTAKRILHCLEEKKVEFRMPHLPAMDFLNVLFQSYSQGIEDAKKKEKEQQKTFLETSQKTKKLKKEVLLTRSVTIKETVRFTNEDATEMLKQLGQVENNSDDDDDHITTTAATTTAATTATSFPDVLDR